MCTFGHGIQKLQNMSTANRSGERWVWSNCILYHFRQHLVDMQKPDKVVIWARYDRTRDELWVWNMKKERRMCSQLRRKYRRWNKDQLRDNIKTNLKRIVLRTHCLGWYIFRRSPIVDFWDDWRTACASKYGVIPQ